MALLAAISASASQAFLSRPILGADERAVAFLTVIIGLVISGFLTLLVTEVSGPIQPPSIIIILLFASVGTLGFGVGRPIFYKAIKNVGANVSAPLVTVVINVVSVLLAILILRETMTEVVALGIAAVVTGVLLLEGRKSATLREGSYKSGYASIVVSGTIAAFTLVMISYGVSVYHYFIASVFISFAAASVYYSVTLGAKPLVSLVRKTRGRSLFLLIATGVLATSAQLFRFGALSYAPVIIVTPFLYANSLFVPALTWVFAREVEVFNVRIVLGVTVITAGLILVVL